MNKFKRSKLYLIILLLLIFISDKVRKIFKDVYHDNQILKMESDQISIVINTENLTENKHILFSEFMKQLNSTRNFYFIKTFGKPLNGNLKKIVENSFVKIVQSNFPDSIFLPLVVSLYGNKTPELVVFIEGDELMDNSRDNLIKWINNAYKQIMKNQYDYIFGNYQIIEGKKIGCSLLFSRASIIEHLLYYTDSDTTHANPFIQLSFVTQTKFCFIPFNYLNTSILENTNDRFSLNMNCPSINDKNLASLCIMLPNFKRNYFSFSFPAFSKQTYKPKFYVIIQNENRTYYNLTLIQKMINEPVYHIWMPN